MKRITKKEAQKRFFAGEIIYFCPCKMSPDWPWFLAMPIHPKDYLERAKGYPKGHTLWAGSLEKTAWELAYDNWAYYNTNYEMGYYAHYYREG